MGGLRLREIVGRICRAVRRHLAGELARPVAHTCAELGHLVCEIWVDRTSIYCLAELVHRLAELVHGLLEVAHEIHYCYSFVLGIFKNLFWFSQILGCSR